MKFSTLTAVGYLRYAAAGCSSLTVVKRFPEVLFCLAIGVIALSQHAQADGSSLTPPTIISSTGDTTYAPLVVAPAKITWKAPAFARYGVAGYNIYLSDVYIDTVTADVKTYRIENVGSWQELSLTAFDLSGNFSGRSNGVRPHNRYPLGPIIANQTRPIPPSLIWIAGGLGYQVDWLQRPGSDPDGIGGYNIYKNGRYIASTTYKRNFVDPVGYEPGDCYTVAAWDNGSPVRFSELSGALCYPASGAPDSP